jgi:microsomal dipeptidase-like Zn-dependent dipeptidase
MRHRDRGLFAIAMILFSAGAKAQPAAKEQPERPADTQTEIRLKRNKHPVLAYGSGLYRPSGLSGYADLHVHQFTNLALGGTWLYGRAWPDGSNGYALPSTRAQMQTAIPRCSGNVPGEAGSVHAGLDLGKASTFFGVGEFAAFAVNEAWGADTGLHAGRRHGVCQLKTVLGVGFCRGYGGPNSGCIALTESQCTTGVQSPCTMDSWANLCRDKLGDDFSVGGLCNTLGPSECENVCWQGNVACRGNIACNGIARKNCPSSSVCTWRPAGNLCRDRSGDGIDAGVPCNTNGGNNTDCSRQCYWDPNVIIGHPEVPAHDFTDRHPNDGQNHASWPSWDSVAHQQVYVDWLKRAYDGGLRLMIMSALNNETLCRLLPNGTPCDDMTSVNAQLAEAKAMDNVSAYGFYEIVYTAAQARATIGAGRMAVVLSVEASDIFNGADPIGTLVGLYNNGVRTLQPMHQFNGKLGGVAFHDEVIAAMQIIKNAGNGELHYLCKSFSGNGSYAPCNAKIGNINYKGLSPVGKNFIVRMMRLGMPIDIAHMSEKSIADTQALTAGTCNYPVYVSHGHVRDLLERGSDFPTGTDQGWKAKNSHEKTVPDWVINYISASGGLFGLRTGADYYDFPTYQQFLTVAGLGTAPVPSRGSLEMNGKPKKLGGTEYHFAYAVDYLTRVKHVQVALGSDFNGMIEQMLFDNESLPNCPGTAATDTQDCEMAGMAHIGKEDVLMNQKLNATGLQNVVSYGSLRNNSADAYVQMWERATSIAAGNCCVPVAVSQIEPAKAYNGGTSLITINGSGFNALVTMTAKLRAYQGTAEYPCAAFQMINSTQATCYAPAGLPVGFYDVIVSNKSSYCDLSGQRTKAVLMTDIPQSSRDHMLDTNLEREQSR